ncbi:hypothetical protein COCOBI_02-5840 [Coccomyxa sp. Obi]|nr:hypothetical protein COCOBI_02-5840 [Coccomyxa sp. Obi]
MQDIELIQQLGRLSWVTESAREDPLQVFRNTVQQQTAVIAFKGQYYSGLPFQDPIPVLLKEFLPGARSVACNELQTLVHLAEGLPGSKWHAAREAMSADLPIVPLLGYFWGSQSNAGASMSAEEEKVLWLVYKFEKLQPLTYYAAAAQSQPTSGLGLWGPKSTEEDELRDRCRMVRTICRGMLQALSFCHKRGVAHGSFGPGSVMLSTFRDCQARELIVKLDNFGFAQMQKRSAPGALYPSPQALDPDHPLSLAQQEDLKAAGLVVLETVICALAEGGPSDATSSAALQRLLFDVFGSDVHAFRKHCNQEQDWTLAGALLDEYNGWQLVTDLISGQKSAQECLVNPFVFGV